jgi:hypothetical protein
MIGFQALKTLGLESDLECVVGFEFTRIAFENCFDLHCQAMPLILLI